MISAQAVPSPPASGARTGRAGYSAGLRTRWALLLSVAGGLALYAAFPPVDAWPLAAAGPGLLVVALAGRSLRGAFGCGLAFGLSLFIPLLSWLVNEAWYAWFGLAGVLAVIFAAFAVGQRLLLGVPYWPAAVAGWWVLVEGVRDRWPYAFPWGRLAMSQSVAPDVRWVAVGGAPLLSFLVALAGAMLARAVLALGGSDPPQTSTAGGAARPPVPPRGGAARPPVPPRGGAARPPGALGRLGRPGRLGPALAAVVTCGLVLAGGLLPADPTGGAPTAQVAAIQGDVPRARNLPQQLNDTEVTQNHTAATLRLAAQVKAGRLAAPDLVIWPENSTDLDPFQDSYIYGQIAGAVAAVGHPVLVGEVLNDPRRNVGQLWVPGRGPTTAYVKRQLVPFGEYIPFRGLISSFSSLTRWASTTWCGPRSRRGRTCSRCSPTTPTSRSTASWARPSSRRRWPGSGRWKPTAPWCTPRPPGRARSSPRTAG